MLQRTCPCGAPYERPTPAPPPCPPRACQCDECRAHRDDCGCRPRDCDAPRDCCHPCDARPARPCPPPYRPTPCYPQRPIPNGFLLPRIVAAGREWQRRCQLTLMVDGLPMGAEPPLTLLEVTSCGQPTWELIDCDDPRAMMIHVHVPLTCQVRDRCNRVYTGHTAITADVRLRMNCPRSECWRGNLLVLPCVRLICVPCSEEKPTFDVLLEVLVEAYMTRWEPCLSADQPKPCCPDLPLFPQPCFR